MKIKKRLSLALTCIVATCSYLVNAQPTPHAYDKWYFGFMETYDAANQLAIPAVALATEETNASYCDASGALWFYSNGTHLRNIATGTVLNNRLNSCPNSLGSTAQGIIFLPKPGGAPNEFYIFTTSDAQSATPYNFGLSYYEYNANVVGASSLGPLQRPTINFYTTEGLTIVPHCNGTDYWVIVKPIINPPSTVINSNNNSPTTPYGSAFLPNAGTQTVNANSLLAYKVSSSGVDNTPVVTNFPAGTGFTPDQTNPFNWVSIMKSSPDRELFAISERLSTGGAINLYRFNCATGQFSFIVRRTQSVFPYGFSFSPNSQYLYTGNGTSSILQYDVSHLWDSTVVCDSLPVDTFSIQTPDPLYQMQLTPSGKIAIANLNETYLDLLNTPNNSNPTYQNSAVALSTAASCKYGLPNNIDGICNSIQPIDFEACVCGCRVNFKFLGCGGDITWDFGDGTVVTGAAFSDIPANVPFTTGTFMSPFHAYTHSGTYTVTVSAGGQTATHQVVFNSTCTEWNIATEDPAVNHWEQGNDIVTDAAGNIYVAGSFRVSAKFHSPNGCSDIVLPGNGGTEPLAYIAKYNSCGELIWINFDNSNGMSTGTSLALDPIRQVVYLTGTTTDGNLRFQATAAKPCGSYVSGPLISGPHQPYIAKFSTMTGSSIDVTFMVATSFVDDPAINIAAQNVNSTTTDLYYSFSYILAGKKYFDIRKVINTNSTYSVLWLTSNVSSALQDLTVNDLVVNNLNSLLYFGGAFLGTLTVGSSSITTAGCQDGFMAALDANTGAYISGTLRRAGISGTANLATVTGLAIDAGNSVYFTGYSTQPITNIFGSTTNFTGTPGLKASFLLKYPSNMGLLSWAQEIRSNFGDVAASGVVTTTKAAFVTGSFNGNITFPSVFVPNGMYTSQSSPSLDKVFIARYSSSGVAGWLNGTNDNVIGVTNSLHIPTRIATANGFTYTTGGFLGNMGYNSVGSPAPPSGPLNYAISPAGQFNNQNMFIIRNDVTSSVFREYEEEEGNEDLDIAGSANERKGFSAFVYPNPNNGFMQVKINLDEISTGTLSIYDIAGKKVLDFTLHSSENKFEINGSDLNAGVYFYNITVNGRIMQSNKLVIIK